MHVCRYERRYVHKIDRYIDGNQIDIVSSKGRRQGIKRKRESMYLYNIISLKSPIRVVCHDVMKSRLFTVVKIGGRERASFYIFNFDW